MKQPTILLTILAILRGYNGQCLINNARISFGSTDGLLCINSEFIESHSMIDSQLINRYYKCAFLCSRNGRCQAFTLADGPCQLFVFDKCSKSVRNCACSRRGQVFVKRQPDLPLGQLCPADFKDNQCGLKYKVTPPDTWQIQRQRCESEKGLTIMADIANMAEMDHIGLIFSTSAANNSMWLGGMKSTNAGTTEWKWLACNIAVNADLWSPGEPSNTTLEDAIFGRTRIGDANQNSNRAGLCECLSPFD